MAALRSLTCALCAAVAVTWLPMAPAVARPVDGTPVRERLVFARPVPMGVDEIRNELFSSRPDGTDVKRLTFGHEKCFPG
jgi:hypothetical protein